MTVGERIKERRLALQMTQEELAQRIKSTKQTIYKYENNIVTSIPYDKLYGLARALGVEPNYLMGWTHASSPIPPAEMAHLEKYRALDAEDQDTVDGLTESLLSKSKYHTAEDSGQTGAA